MHRPTNDVQASLCLRSELLKLPSSFRQSAKRGANMIQNRVLLRLLQEAPEGYDQLTGATSARNTHLALGEGLGVAGGRVAAGVVVGPHAVQRPVRAAGPARLGAEREVPAAGPLVDHVEEVEPGRLSGPGGRARGGGSRGRGGGGLPPGGRELGRGEREWGRGCHRSSG